MNGGRQKMKITIDRRKIDKSGEFDFLITENEIKRILQKNIDFLATHNKNLTKEQYNRIIELQTIIQTIK